MIKIRQDIGGSFEIIKTAVAFILEKNVFSFQELNTRLSKSAGSSLYSGFLNKITSLEEEESIGTTLIYSNALSSIKKYTKNKDITYDKVTVDWLKKLEM